MPPYRTGLHKRKRDFDQNKSEEEVPVEKEESSLDSAGEEDLIKGAANAEGDDDESDSENEPDVAAASDGERDEVLFEDDADSILSDVDKETGDSAEDLSNSEEHSDTNESDDSDERHEGGEHSKEGKESTDSGAESEPVPDSSSEDSSSRQDTEPKKKGKRRTKSKHKKSESSVDKLADKINAGHINLQPVEQRDEYESGDTSDEEDRRTTVGDVPLHWYREYPHVGYDLEGRRVLRAPHRDAIDSFLKQCEDPEFWRTVRDPSTGQDVVLAREDLQLLQRLRAARPPADDQHEPWVEWFSRSVLATPLRAFPEHKRSFLPSRDEQRHVARLVHALRMGWAKTRKQIADERRKRKEKQFYALARRELQPTARVPAGRARDGRLGRAGRDTVAPPVHLPAAAPRQPARRARLPALRARAVPALPRPLPRAARHQDAADHHPGAAGAAAAGAARPAAVPDARVRVPSRPHRPRALRRLRPQRGLHRLRRRRQHRSSVGEQVGALHPHLRDGGERDARVVDAGAGAGAAGRRGG